MMGKRELNILFICKYNRFRSRVASAYFQKLNKNKSIHVKSGGIIVGHYPLNEKEVAIAKKLGADIRGRPEPVTTDKLMWQDMIIIAADNVPPYLFHFNKKRFGKSVRCWPIPDIKHGEDGKRIEQIIKMIKKHVESLVEELK